MAIKVDSNVAMNELIKSLERVRTAPVKRCRVSSAIDTVLSGEKCLTYQYILATALVAKVSEPMVDMLSLQVEDESEGAYAPRSLCKDVVYPFQKRMLEDVLDGANNDPLVNKPARFLRLSKKNQARGDGRKALDALCDSLPLIDSQEEAQSCLDYLMTCLLYRAEERRQMRENVENAIRSSSSTDLRDFLSALLDQGFGGNALVLAVSALYRIQYPESQGFKVIPHPVNQPGSSSRQLSDLDLEFNGKPFLATELKDKPFVEDDVRRAASTAAAGGVPGVLFISGRFGSLNDRTQGYFSSVRNEFAHRGIYVGLCDVDDFMDVVLTTHPDIDVTSILREIYRQVCDNAGTTEAQMWVYEQLSAFSAK